MFAHPVCQSLPVKGNQVARDILTALRQDMVTKIMVMLAYVEFLVELVLITKQALR